MKERVSLLETLETSLNQSCLCIVLRPGEVGASFAGATGGILPADLEVTHPHLFAQTPVYISQPDLALMLSFAMVMERITALQGWLPNRAMLPISNTANVHGVFMGFDFHMTPDGPKLIEINTNAGGAFLNLFVSKQFRACCDMLDMSKFIQPLDAEKNIADMFIDEWKAAGREGKPTLIAIVDNAPKEQFLYPEFLLAAKLLNDHGLQTIIAAPHQLVLENGKLNFEGKVVDFIYNRLTDFSLAENLHIQSAWQAGQVVLSPDPNVYERFADKRNLVRLSDSDYLATIGVSEADIAIIKSVVPKTVLVSVAEADALWANRKHLYFKPATGFGSKAVYKGEKLTRKSWDWIVSQNYVAQDFASPSQRAVKADGKVGLQKFDVRLYTYRGQLLAAAARIYQGQTTNFRTPGGGFAPLTTF
jgi:hypothetical protein